MRVSSLILICLTATAALCGCKRADVGSWVSGNATRHGRYASVGVYSPGLAWQQLVTQRQASEPTTAKLTDDQAILVLEDSDTGEIRACGDMSGYCVGMNPWARPLVRSQSLPVDLKVHANPVESVSEAANAAINAAESVGR